MRFVVVVGVLSFASCQRPPCIEPVEHAVFAVRGFTTDAGAENCPAVLEGTLTVASQTSAHFVFDGGFEGDCSLTTQDDRPEYSSCQTFFTCSWSRGGFNAFSFTVPEHRGEVLDGKDGPVTWSVLNWNADGCIARYRWSAAPRGAP